MISGSRVTAWIEMITSLFWEFSLRIFTPSHVLCRTCARPSRPRATSSRLALSSSEKFSFNPANNLKSLSVILTLNIVKGKNLARSFSKKRLRMTQKNYFSEAGGTASEGSNGARLGAGEAFTSTIKGAGTAGAGASPMPAGGAKLGFFFGGGTRVKSFLESLVPGFHLGSWRIGQSLVGICRPIPTSGKSTGIGKVTSWISPAASNTIIFPMPLQKPVHSRSYSGSLDSSQGAAKEKSVYFKPKRN